MRKYIIKRICFCPPHSFLYLLSNLHSHFNSWLPRRVWNCWNKHLHLQYKTTQMKTFTRVKTWLDECRMVIEVSDDIVNIFSKPTITRKRHKFDSHEHEMRKTWADNRINRRSSNLFLENVEICLSKMRLLRKVNSQILKYSAHIWRPPIFQWKKKYFWNFKTPAFLFLSSALTLLHSNTALCPIKSALTYPRSDIFHTNRHNLQLHRRLLRNDFISFRYTAPSLRHTGRP